MKFRRRWVIPAILTMVSACAADSRSVAPTGPEALIEPSCQAGCVETDPYPDSAGVFLGSSVTGEVCSGGGQSDHDGDGLSTFCETNLAAAFAPELYYWAYDEVGREPYWAARTVLPYNADTVKIAYLIGYYRDAGSPAYICHVPWLIFPVDPSCNGHNGDSEAIILKVYYNVSTQHWVLALAKYSQHSSYGVYDKGNKAYPTQLTYPSHPGTYPRAYVSEGKHANYRSKNECNAGGTANTDTCTSVDTPARLATGGAYNLGSNGVRLIDCVGSRDPSYIYYGSGRQECFWSTRNFRGWIPTTVGGDESDPYSDRLAAEGF